MRKELEQIKKIAEKLKTEYAQSCKSLTDKSNKLIESCNKVDKSWSQSFVGYHGQLYFRNFDTPEHRERFSSEWGGINGIPAGWVKKDAEEVKSKIESNISAYFSIDDLEKEEATLKEKAEESLHEITIILSSINLDGMNAEKELQSEIEKFKFGKGKNHFIDTMIPTQLISRDKEALIQGTCTPAHIFYQGVGQSIIDICSTINQFLKLIDRFTRQLEIKKSQPFGIPQNTWNWVNPFWWLWQLLLFILKFLKFAWNHKIISVIIVIITLLAVDYSLAWKNLLNIWELIQSLWPQNTTANTS